MPKAGLTPSVRSLALQALAERRERVRVPSRPRNKLIVLLLVRGSEILYSSMGGDRTGSRKGGQPRKQKSIPRPLGGRSSPALWLGPGALAGTALTEHH